VIDINKEPSPFERLHNFTKALVGVARAASNKKSLKAICRFKFLTAMDRSVKNPQTIPTDRLHHIIEASRKLAEKSDRIRHESEGLRAYSWSLILESEKLKSDAGWRDAAFAPRKSVKRS
jgi:hypothetical protein